MYIHAPSDVDRLFSFWGEYSQFPNTNYELENIIFLEFPFVWLNNYLFVHFAAPWTLPPGAALPLALPPTNAPHTDIYTYM